MLRKLFSFLVIIALVLSCGQSKKAGKSETANVADTAEETQETTQAEVVELIPDSELGFIKQSLDSENTLEDEPMDNYLTALPGQSTKFDRAFENAPPMIPHSVEGFFPIRKEQNICLTCHLPALAIVTGAVALPETHFTNLRPEITQKDDLYHLYDINNKVHKSERSGQLVNAYFNCNQCHVPQANVTVDIQNLFTPEFREMINKNSSTLNQQLNEGF